MAARKPDTNVGKPFVSVCTPTLNRRKFIPALTDCFNAQTYPKDRMEWIVVDDGSDSVCDLFSDINGASYYYSKEAMTIGQKRNFMHSKANGDIIVYMDDDDYYPPDRVLHAVNMLRANPKKLIAGSSVMHICFNKLGKIFKFGPYGPNHATAATFAFKKELLSHTGFDAEAKVSEEKYFLKDYSIPMIQLEPKKTILVFAHPLNTYDKNRLLVNPDPKYVKETKFAPRVFIKNEELREFYCGL